VEGLIIACRNMEQEDIGKGNILKGIMAYTNQWQTLHLKHRWKDALCFNIFHEGITLGSILALLKGLFG